MRKNVSLLGENYTLPPAVEAAIQEILTDKSGFETIQKEDNLTHDLGLDSLDKIELVMDIERKFEIDIPDELEENIQTVGDLYQAVALLLSKK